MIKRICIDLDGTLVKTDMLYESFIYVMKKKPLTFLKALFLLIKYGKARFKSHLAKYFEFQPSILPFNKQVEEFIDKQRSRFPDAEFYLVSASASSIVDTIATYTASFSGCYGSSDTLNLSAERKAEFLNQLFGYGGYVYVGNSFHDIPVWRCSSEAVCVDTPKAVIKRLDSLGVKYCEIRTRNKLIKTVAGAIRLRQWPKNLLLFVPLITADLFTDIHSVISLMIAFLSFSLLSSFVYVLNDLLDLENDRSHPSKKNRPFASGALSIKAGLLLLPLLFISSLALSLILGGVFASCLIVYLIITTVYSFKLKQFPMLDCMVLSFLYTFRMITGIMVLNVPMSLWLITFSGFFFLSLALVKRMAEIRKKQEDKVISVSDSAPGAPASVPEKVMGRGYSVADYPILSQISVAAGFISTLVFALYVNSSKVQMFPHPMIVCCCGPVLVFWFSYIFLKTHRGEMSDDPVMFAIKDRTSLVSGILFVGLFISGVIS